MSHRAAEGSNAGMAFTYRAPEVATDPLHTFPWAARLVVVAWPYLPAAGSPGIAASGTGRIARFATEDHYIELAGVLTKVVQQLELEGFRAEAIWDDSRLVDRAVAVRAGIGWWGKNAMVLSPGIGPWFLVGSVATDAPIQVTLPMIRDCGTCSACLPACPTGALTAPGVLDARLCLAHILQSDGVIPRALRSAVGDRIYGCDDCLDACPPGSRIKERATDPRGRVDLNDLLASPDRLLMERYTHFFIPGRRARYLRRNALVALGNGGGMQAIPVLAGYLGHPDWLLRLHAAWALGAVGGKQAEAVLGAAAGSEPHENVRAEIDAARSST